MRKITYLTGLLILLFICFDPLTAYAFSDTNQHWARPKIDHLQNRGLISGYPDGTFGPERDISRAEFVTLLINALNKSEEAKQLFRGQCSFSDSSDHWARGYIELARELNITHGDGRGNFYPLTPISREEAVTMLVSSLGTMLPDSPQADFSDGAAISTWAQKSVDYAVQKGLVHGYPDGSFKPGRNLTRAEVAVMMEQFLALQGQKFHFYGTLEQIDLPLKRAVITINGREEAFELAANIIGYQEGQNQPLNQLDLPVNAYFSLNSEGKLAYLYLSDEDTSGKVNVYRQPLPGLEISSATEGNVVKLTEDVEIEKSELSVLSRPELSLKTTGEAMGVSQFRAETGASGLGQLVAVIDSGIDPGHPDLQTTSQGYRKVIDFIDLSDEGLVELTTAQAVDGFLTIGDKKVDVSSINNVSNVFKYGYFNLDFLPTNFGLEKRQLLIVATAGKYSTVFDTVYMDTDFDGQIADETGLQQYSRQGKVAAVAGEGNAVFNLSVAEISDEGDYVKLGFDMLGHGTEVAGIVAAHGKIEGIAPDAQLLPIKVMDRSGTTTLKKIESGLSLAADRGAKIAVVSMGQYRVNKTEMKSLEKLLANIQKVSGMLVCMAAGNNGPGLGTVTETATANNIISVGAYATPEMWQTDYGWQVEKPTLWYVSSCGPGADGSAAPMLIAPGNAVSTYPLWKGQPYRLDEGTSIAAPHVAGAAALLLDAGTSRFYLIDPRLVGRALLAGANPLDGFQAAEQGLGAVDLGRAWNELLNMKGSAAMLEGSQISPGIGISRGFYSRGLAPGELTLSISNNGDENEQLSIIGLESWVKPKQYTVQVPAHGQRSVAIEYEKLQAGLNSTFLVADKYNTPEWDVAMLQTVILPYQLGVTDEKVFEEEGELPAGQFKRYFFRIPEGMTGVSFKLLASDNGRVRMHVISPRGDQDVSQYAGVGESQVMNSVTIPYSQPKAGIWEVVVYSSATLSDYGLKTSHYTLQVIPQSKGKKDSKMSNDMYLITAVPPDFKPGEKTFVTLYFWYAGGKMPAEGMVSINDRLYEIKNGMVRLEVEPGQDKINFSVAW